ncbi:MAG: thioredoxin domain-containing protein, partial [Solirubrobacteraceae bacterium]
EATFAPRWFRVARELADEMIERFADPDGGFFTTAADHELGFERRHDLDDSPVPAGGSAAAFGLLRLAALTGEHAYEERALGVLGRVAPIAGRHPHGFGHALQAIDFHLADVREVAIVGDDIDDLDELARVVRAEYRPHVVLAGGGRAPTASGREPLVGVPLLAGRPPVDGQAAAYVCEHFSCRAPVTSAAELSSML